MMDAAERAKGEARARDYPHEAAAIAKLIEAENPSREREIAMAELWLARARHLAATAAPDEIERMSRVVVFCEQQLAERQGGPRPDVSDDTLDAFMRRVF